VNKHSDASQLALRVRTLHKRVTLAAGLMNHTTLVFVLEPRILRCYLSLLLKANSYCLQPYVRIKRLIVSREIVPLVILVQTPQERLAHKAIIQIYTCATAETRTIDVLLQHEMLFKRLC
jgi:hypothetical protein